MNLETGANHDISENHPTNEVNNHGS